jgi:hypothetical protein
MSSSFADPLSGCVRVLSMRLSSSSVIIFVFNVSASFDVKLAGERKTSLASRQVPRRRCPVAASRRFAIKLQEAFVEQR